MKTLGITAVILALALAACSDGSDVSPVPNVNDPDQPPAVEVTDVPTDNADVPVENAVPADAPAPAAAAEFKVDETAPVAQ